MAKEKSKSEEKSVAQGAEIQSESLIQEETSGSLDAGALEALDEMIESADGWGLSTPRSIEEECRAFIDVLDVQMDELNANHTGDGAPGVNIHGTRLMARFRVMKDAVIGFADFLKKEKIQ